MLARSSFAETRRVGSQPPFDSVLSETHCWQQQFSFVFFVNQSFFAYCKIECATNKISVLFLNNFVCWTLWRHFDFPQGKLSFRIYGNFMGIYSWNPRVSRGWKKGCFDRNSCFDIIFFRENVSAELFSIFDVRNWHLNTIWVHQSSVSFLNWFFFFQNSWKN